jgi:hypothetical protein
VSSQDLTKRQQASRMVQKELIALLKNDSVLHPVAGGQVALPP